MKRMTTVLALFLVVGCPLLYGCQTTKQSNAEEQEQLSPEQMRGYMEVMMKAMIEIYASPEMAKIQARFYRNLYEALIETGFTEEEALQIVIAQGSILSSGQK